MIAFYKITRERERDKELDKALAGKERRGKKRRNLRKIVR